MKQNERSELVREDCINGLMKTIRSFCEEDSTIRKFVAINGEDVFILYTHNDDCLYVEENEGTYGFLPAGEIKDIFNEKLYCIGEL